jgi:tRNA(Ile2) C34 agmatinyltransferase TiaS
MRYSREQKRAELLKTAEAMIDEFLDWEEQAEKPNLSEIEAAVLKVRRQMSERMAVVAIEDQDAAQPVEAPLCPECGARMRYKGLKPRTVVSLVGTLRFRRAYYHCSHPGGDHFPPPEPT